jgi:hypothetical protein
MHSSGTSALTGSLQQYGMFVGVRGGANATGRLRENFDIVGIHDGILARAGGSWDDPPESPEWLPEHFTRAREVLAAFAHHAVFGFKDPRTLLTFEGWEQLVPDIEPVGIVRHPLRVARSLLNRGGGDWQPQDPEPRFERALALWQTYNSRLLEIHDRSQFPLISFDEEPDVFQAKLQELARRLDLDAEPTGDSFFAPGRRRPEIAEGPLPAQAEELYRDLAARTI